MDFNNVVHRGSNWAQVAFSDPDATVVVLGGGDREISGTANAVGDTLTAVVNGQSFQVVVTPADDQSALRVSL